MSEPNILPIIPEKINCYIRKLVSKYPHIVEVWLLGSRANGSNRENSDWDLLIFANECVLGQLEKDTSFNNGNIDLLVVYNGNDFKNPWTSLDNGHYKPKSGKLNDWKWKKLSLAEAEYEGAKLLPDGIRLDFKKLKALKLWPET